jgi:hypothetical protein
MCIIPSIPHGFGFTRSLQAMVLTVMGTVLDFDNPMETVPIPVVSRYHTYTLSGSGPNNNDNIPLKTCSKPPTSKVAHVLFKQAHQSLTLACINSIAGQHTLLSCCYFHTYVSYYCITYLLQQMGKHISQKVHDNWPKEVELWENKVHCLEDKCYSKRWYLK